MEGFSDEVWLELARGLRLRDLFRFRAVCTQFRRVAQTVFDDAARRMTHHRSRPPTTLLQFKFSQTTTRSGNCTASRFQLFSYLCGDLRAVSQELSHRAQRHFGFVDPIPVYDSSVVDATPSCFVFLQGPIERRDPGAPFSRHRGTHTAHHHYVVWAEPDLVALCGHLRRENAEWLLDYVDQAIGTIPLEQLPPPPVLAPQNPFLCLVS